MRNIAAILSAVLILAAISASAEAQYGQSQHRVDVIQHGNMPVLTSDAPSLVILEVKCLEMENGKIAQFLGNRHKKGVFTDQQTVNYVAMDAAQTQVLGCFYNWEDVKVKSDHELEMDQVNGVYVVDRIVIMDTEHAVSGSENGRTTFYRETTSEPVMIGRFKESAKPKVGNVVVRHDPSHIVTQATPQVRRVVQVRRAPAPVHQTRWPAEAHVYGCQGGCYYPPQGW